MSTFDYFDEEVLEEQTAIVSEIRGSSGWRTVFVIGGGLLVLLCSIGLLIWCQFSTWFEQQNSQLATLMATDDTIAEFGDGGHLVPITPSAAYQIGVPVTLDGLRITVTKSGESVDYQGSRLLPDDYTFWAVDFTLENISNETQYVNPIVDSQVQYRRHSSYRRGLGFATTDPTLLQGVITMAQQTQLQGILVYEVPEEANELFWVYEKAGYYVVFKVK